MTVRSKLALGLAAGALVIASVSPAAARGYNGRWHRHDGPDAGAVIGVIAGIGIIAAIASAASANRQQADRRAREPGYDPRYDDRGYNDRRYGSPRYEEPRYDGRADDRRYESGSGRAAYSGEDAAVDDCAVAARTQVTNGGGFAEVRSITGVRALGNGWDVTGTVSQRSSFRASDDRVRSFRCVWENGRVGGVSFN